jgi:hypothetical protein
MAKILKITLKALGSFIEWTLILVILFAFLIRTSTFQTFLASKATDYLSKELNTEVKIDEVAITFFDEVALDGLLIKDLDKDTLISAKTLFVNVSLLDIQKKHFKLTSAVADEAYVHIKRDKNGFVNTQFLKDYFSKTPSKENKIIFELASGELINSRFKYDDAKHTNKKGFGIDFFHIHASEINGEISNLSVIKDVISGDISQFAFKEKSGFNLENLRSGVQVSPRGVLLSEVVITTKRSSLFSPSFKLLSKEYPDFKHFVDSVEFDASLTRSKVSLADVSYFSPNLLGMNDVITISGDLSNSVKDLKITQLDLRYRDKTNLRGTINLPDYRNIDQEFLHEKLTYAHIDIEELEKLRFPNSSDNQYISLDEKIKRLGYFEGTEIRFDGYLSQFVIATDIMKTELGNARLNNGIMFTETSKGYSFKRSEAAKYDVKLEQFALGKLMKDNRLGQVDGTFFLSGEIRPTDILFDEIRGNINRFDFMNYAYSNIEVLKGEFIDNKFAGKIDIKDDNLNLTYDGFIDLKGDQQMAFNVDLADAILDNLGLSKKDSRVRSSFQVDLTGKSSTNFNGKIKMNGFVLVSKGRTFSVPYMDLDISRGQFKDIFNITSSAGKMQIEGKIDFNYLIDDFKYQISRIFPSLYKDSQDKRERRMNDHFTYDIEIGDIDSLLAIFAPKLHVAPGTKLKGNYFGESSNLVMNVTSPEMRYDEMIFEDFSVRQVMDSSTIMANYHVHTFHYNDSTAFHDIYFKGDGTNNHLVSSLTWEQGQPTSSALYWVTDIRDINHFQFKLDPSYFHVKNKRWDIVNESTLIIEGDTVSVDDFKLSRNDQFISVDGQMSNQDRHRLLFEINELDLAEIDWLLTTDHNIQGRVNAWGFVSNPVHNFYYLGDANIDKLEVDGNEIGDIFIQSSWNNELKSVGMTGDLIYKHQQTFNFAGDYYQEREQDNLDLKLVFDYMDIHFANAFMDPDVMNNIKGLVVGELNLTGEPDKPVLDGIVDLKGGSALIGFLGTHFIAEGPIEVDKYGFYINSIPVYDEEGNAGSLVGSVYHDNFKNFNFDLQFDIENDAVNKDPIQPWRPAKLDRFLIMNTPYDPDFAYFGKAYATGEVNIFGYTNNLEVTVNVKSEEGTSVSIPMYGVGEIEEEQNFLQFKTAEVISDTIIPLIDLTGVDLDLNMEVTPEAEVRIVFNEDTGDEIRAQGSGNVSMTVDNFGHIGMEGTFTVKEGVYDFAMGPIRQKFFLEEGGTMTWTGDPYDADINLRAYYRTFTNIADLSADEFASGSGGHQLILSYLTLQESLLKPTIGFDLQAPQANDMSQSLIARVKSDPDELNRQFFSLLLWRKFQPITGSRYEGTSAAMDLVSNQINSLLGQISQEYTLNVNIDQDDLSGDNLYEFGVSKGFLDNKLIVSGSFGVESASLEAEPGEVPIHEQTLLGDVNIEYVLNDDGTFRINIFNESTDRTVIYEAADKGLFTQGAGLSYKEDFNNFRDFSLIQTFFNLFRKKKNRIRTQKRQDNLIPVKGIKEEEE